MKVTVCFGAVRVLVPCGSGELLVRDLVREATLRYKKATGQGAESWVEVRALRASSGGILDPDDRVRDVADDRETLAAECHAPDQPVNQRHHGGDGASGSSVGTASPDMFRPGCGVGAGETADLGVTVGATEEGGGGLQVRRGSEPTLHQDSVHDHQQLNDQTKRWSAAVVCRDDSRPQKLPSVLQDQAPSPTTNQTNQMSPPAQPFQRQSNRLSMQFSGTNSGNWLDAADRVQTIGTKSLPRDSRKEPLGQDTIANRRVEDTLRWVSGVNGTSPSAAVQPQERPLERLPEVAVNGNGSEVAVSAAGATRGAGQLLTVALVKGERGLGFTITTRDNPTGGHAPIYIKNILPKGAAVTDGRLRAGDRLVAVNGGPVAGLAQQQVVAILRNTPLNSTVNLLIERQRTQAQRADPQQTPASGYTEKAVGTPEPPATAENGRVSAIVSALNRSSRFTAADKHNQEGDKQNQDGDSTQDVLNSSHNSLPSLRNRRILQLEVPVHDSEKAGLGVSVKGKVTVGPDPHDLGIFIKSVLHGGAASRDGRLHTNDQLLNVNGVSLVGQSNAEAMETLRRALLQGNLASNICLTVARRTDSMDNLARWKDDTPTDSSGNSTTDTQHNTVIYNTLNNNNSNNTENTSRNNSNMARTSLSKSVNDNDKSNGKRHASIVTINNNNSWTDDSKSFLNMDKSPTHDSKRDSFEWSRLEGWNPAIDRLTGLRNDSYYMATHDHTMRFANHQMRSPTHNVIIEEETANSTKASSPVTNGSNGAPNVYESGSESAGETAFTRDAVGRRSMSEKRHATVDAKTTDTYRKIKEQKAINALQSVGPTLGMRKSSSLESLQTAVQEQQRQPIYQTRHHPPRKMWLTEDATEMMVRGSPQLSSLSHKKPSLLKSLSSMLKFGNKPKKPDEIYGRSTPGRASEKSLSRETMERRAAELSERASQRYHERSHQGPLPDRPHQGLAPDRTHDKEKSDRGLLERIYGEHERRASERHMYRVPDISNHRVGGSHSRQASSDKSEGRGGAGERLYAQHPHHPHQPHQPPYQPQTRIPPPHHHVSKMMEGAWGATGHYVNYQEIQQNLNLDRCSSARREKLSEVQIGQMRRTVHEQRAKVEEESRRAGAGGTGGYHSQRASSGAVRPQSNYYEYDSAAPHRRRDHIYYR